MKLLAFLSALLTRRVTRVGALSRCPACAGAEWVNGRDGLLCGFCGQGTP